MSKQRKIHRRATSKLTELAELITAVDPKGRAPAEWPVLTMLQRKEVVRLLLLIATDVDPRGEYFEGVSNSPGQPEIRQRKFFAELDYRLRKKAGAPVRGLREAVRESWRLTTEQMRRAQLEHAADCADMMQKNTNWDGLRKVLEHHRQKK